MAKQILNIGQEPGNLGDGDNLRTAFIKVKSNFDELYNSIPVTDTTLDHGNPAIEGTIAWALELSHSTGGGTVILAPGKYTCSAQTLNIPTGVTLRGSGRRASIIEVTGDHTCIEMSGASCSLESLHIKMPVGLTGDGVIINQGEAYIKDVIISGGSPRTWGIKVEASNIVYLSNIRMGGSGHGLTGNGIIFQNTSGLTYNFGDSKLSKIDITLSSNHTTGIKFAAPDIINRRINNILLSQVEIIGTGIYGYCTGIHLHNASRIVCIAVDLEQLNIGVLEEGIVGNCRNNVYIATFAIGVRTNYKSSGNVFNRLFIGCQNMSPTGTDSSDMVIPGGIMLNEGTIRLWDNFGKLQVDDGNNENGIQISTNNTKPEIRTSSTEASAMLSIGRENTQGVECIPGITLPPQNELMPIAAEGTIVYYNADIAGTNAGLYQYRSGEWFFIN